MTDESLDQAKLDELSARVARLPRNMEPPADAWQGIAAAITMPQKPVAIALWQRPLFLAAAGLLLVAGSAISAIAVDRMTGSDERVATVPATNTVQPGRAPVALAEFTRRETEYISTTNRLIAMLESDQVQLAPQTVEKLKESIRIIDAAILEARRALADDPANTQLMEMLTRSYDQKVDLLKRTTEMGRS